jgi:hypothetical protein
MENITADQKSVFLLNVKSDWLQEILNLCTIVPLGLVGTVLNLISLRIFLIKSLRKIKLFEYMIVLSIVNSLIALSQIFIFLFSPNLFFELSLSYTGRLFSFLGVNDIYFYFSFLNNLIEIMINIERALYFSEGFEKFKKISSYLIAFLILILSLLVYIPNYLSLKLVPENEIFILNKISAPTDFALTQIGKIMLLVCYGLEGPVTFILLIITNIIAIISFKKYNQRKELQERNNNIEMMAEGEIKKKKKIEKTDRKLLIMASYLTLISLVTSLIQLTARFFYFNETYLSPKTFGWLIFAACFAITLKQFSAIIVYYNYKLYRKELKFFLKRVLNKSNGNIMYNNSGT